MPESYAWYIDAFVVLSHSRPVGEFDGAIPLTEIGAYMGIYGIDGDDEKEEFALVIKQMDLAYLKGRAEAIKRGRDSQTKSSHRRGRG